MLPGVWTMDVLTGIAFGLEVQQTTWLPQLTTNFSVARPFNIRLFSVIWRVGYFLKHELWCDVK